MASHLSALEIKKREPQTVVKEGNKYQLDCSHMLQPVREGGGVVRQQCNGGKGREEETEGKLRVMS